ncbi:MAG: hypothetical protein DDT26_01945 [Dehalococcoidia bacterium]|nr:hypothetical protein [Chloroflexota bacterium]
MKSTFVLIVLAMAAMAVWPFIVIWALNTLFALSIAYTIWSWLAVCVLMIVLATRGVNVQTQ